MDGKTDSCRVAIVGARGIGRHHANWWQMAGADVCAIAGTTRDSVEAAGKVLGEMIGFRGNVYTGVAEMVRAETPDWVDVCSPAACHGPHVETALKCGAHVLCEKPFLFEPGTSAEAMRREARRLIELAEKDGRHLALCTQFAPAAVWCAALMDAGTPLHRFEGRLAAPAKGRPPDSVRVWADLGPHLLAAIQALAPGGDMLPETLEVEFRDGSARCAFSVSGAGGGVVACDLFVGNTEGDPANVRYFKLNDLSFDLDGVKGPDGVFGLRATLGDGRVIDREDSMRELIRATADGRPPLAGDAVYRNQEWLLAVLEAGR